MAGVPKSKTALVLPPNAVISFGLDRITSAVVTKAPGRGEGSNLTLKAAGGQQIVLKGDEATDTPALEAIAAALAPHVVKAEASVREVVEINL